MKGIAAHAGMPDVGAQRRSKGSPAVVRGIRDLREKTGPGDDGAVAGGEVNAWVDQRVGVERLPGVEGGAVQCAARTRNAETGVGASEGGELTDGE